MYAKKFFWVLMIYPIITCLTRFQVLNLEPYLAKILPHMLGYYILLQLLKEIFELWIDTKLGLEHYGNSKGQWPTLFSPGSHLLAHPMLPKVIKVALEDARVLLKISILLDGLKSKPSVLLLHRSQGSKLDHIKVALFFATVEVLIKELLLTLKVFEGGLHKMEKEAL
ncbi:hypothetical protein DSO57_1026951 [Entomophthora muscae]|uniref:Uncharacterized protein n=1 Tax=Entomophthora muscae TaxID=34485 RepID=A0ACC2SQW3_9FUNG|nr:hypothetical protein DSO57_1026951 [Entomophthora muscae]